MSDVFDRKVGSHDRLFMGGQGLADAHQSAVRSGRHTRLPKIGVWRTKRETVDALVQRCQTVDVVADDLEVMNAHLEMPLYWYSGRHRPVHATNVNFWMLR